jgi:hypothetical protein
MISTAPPLPLDRLLSGSSQYLADRLLAGLRWHVDNITAAKLSSEIRYSGLQQGAPSVDIIRETAIM